MKGRPIVAATDSPSTKLSKLFSRHLNYLLRFIPCHLKDGDSFVNFIKSWTMDGEYLIATLDVENLYGSIPYEDDNGEAGLFSIVLRFYEEFRDASDFFREMPASDFLDLLRLSLTSDTILCQNSFYSQSTGLSMGNPVAPQLAIIFMDFVEQKLLDRLSSQDSYIHWKRYIDDVFLVFPSHLDCNDILQLANQIHSKIKFSMQLPNDDGFLPYLDCEVRLHMGRFSSRIYFKECHSGVIQHWTSNSSRASKRGIIMGELRRATFRSTTDFLTYSIDKVLRRFQQNGYPRTFLNRIHKQFESRKDRAERDKAKRLFIKCPFISEDVNRKLLNTLKRTGLNDKVYVCFSNANTRKHFRPPKGNITCEDSCKSCFYALRPNTCHTKGVIYKVVCNLCGMIYIGETQRMIKSRIVEHLNPNNETSHVVLHAQKIHNGQINFQWNILHSNLPYTNKRKTLESMYISKVAKDQLINGCFGHSLHVT